MDEYSLDFKKHKTFLDKIIRGDVVLFTGAGFSLGATVKNNPILSTQALIDKIINELLEEDDPEVIKRIKDRKSFQQICQLAISKITEDAFGEFLVSCFKNVQPSEFHYKYANINWKEIFTLNIDDLIEEVYKHTEVDLQVYDTKKMPIKPSGNNILKYYKLHGNVNNKSEKFVFSSSQYINKLNFSDMVYNLIKFSEILYQETVCMIGTSINEIDLEVYAERFGKAMGSQLPKEKIYYITRTLYKEDIHDFERKNIICIQETTESFINKIIEYRKENQLSSNETQKASSSIKIIKKIDINTKMENLSFRIEQNLKKMYSEEEIKTHKAINFYAGFEPKWIDIIAGSDAILENTKELIDAVSLNNSFKLFLLLGKSGNGKTTNIKRLIYNYSENTDYFVLSHREESALTDDIAYKLALEFNKIEKKIVLTIDNGSWAFNFISILYKNLKEDICISIVISSRIPEYYRELRNLNNIPFHIFNYDQVINRNNAERLITKLEEKSYLGELAQFSTMNKKVDYLIRSYEKRKDLFSCLIYSIKGDGHFGKLDKLIDAQMSKQDNALFLIVLTIFDSFGSFPLPLQLFLNIFEKNIINLRNIISDCSDLLNNTEIKLYDNLQEMVRPRGAYVTKKILDSYKKYFRESEILDITKVILIYVGSNYNVNYNKGKNIYTEITHSLLVSRSYYQNFKINNKALFDTFYYSLAPYFTENSDFWLQFAKMEMKRGDLTSSKIHLEQAIAINPYSYKIKHAIGQWHFFAACQENDFELAKQEFEIGEKIMLEQLGINYAYPVHSYIDGFMEFHKHFKFELKEKKIKDLYKIIEESLLKDPNHSLLLIVWKKFYLFLEKNEVVRYIKINLDDYKRMTYIDINKSAEEQYLI